MEKQHCKVGAITPLTEGQQAVRLLEYQYGNFIRKAGEVAQSDANLREFFELKARKIQRLLQSLV
ncbi:hypothetical protein [Robiginitalea sp. SC105]|uniref:hypothetical protein n=1 Tax=Robiginitalea sp. SC105 TaxID=2762332 RepID=UPI00163A4F2F|nr:hypothetical protein [Robiginitalea sp. SC105]MBC2839881.1 hypothetical protein [Robiginitalea sp. SC105]